MPQVQILGAPQQAPSFASQLGQGLGGGFGQGLSTLLQQHFQRKENTKQLEGLAPIFEQLGVPKEGVAQLISSGLNPQIVAALAGQLGQQQAKFQAAQAKEQATKQAEAEKTEEERLESEDTVNAMVDTLEKGTLGKANILNKAFQYGRQDRAFYDNLALGIERKLVQMVGKGTLQKTRFDYLKGLLPSSSDTDATNRGKLAAIAKELKVEIKHPGFLEKTKGLSNKSEEKTTESEDFVLMQDPQGNIRKIPKSQAKAANQAGGKLVQ